MSAQSHELKIAAHILQSEKWNEWDDSKPRALTDLPLRPYPTNKAWRLVAIALCFFIGSFSNAARAQKSREMYSSLEPAVVLENIEKTRASKKQLVTLQSNIFPSIPMPPSAGFQLFNQEGGMDEGMISVDEPDDIDPGGHSDISIYSLPNDFYFVYQPIAVENDRRADIFARLDALKMTPLYGAYRLLPRVDAGKINIYGGEIEFYVKMNKLNPADLPGIKPSIATRARYAREVSLAGGHFDKSKSVFTIANSVFQFPKEFTALLPTAKRMWVECAVAVDATGVPVDAPLRKVRPIAIEAADTLYLVTQTTERIGVKHGYVVQFNKPTFRVLGNSASVTADMVRNLINIYAENLKKGFEQGILLANEDMSTPPPPGEFHFRRDFKPSKVLDGFKGPYRELSYYNVRWWRMDDAGGELYTLVAAHKGGFGATGSSIVVQVSHSLTTSVGASANYSEPTSEHVARYQTAITSTMETAAASTAAIFNGKSQAGMWLIDPKNLKQK